MEELMLTRILKWSAMAALMGGFFLGQIAGYSTLFQFVVSAAAVAVLVQAASMRRYLWMSLFIVGALLLLSATAALQPQAIYRVHHGSHAWKQITVSVEFNSPRPSWNGHSS
jgi:hypothetical protein